MPSDLRILRLGAGPRIVGPAPPGERFLPVNRRLVHPLAECYLASYPPQVGARDLLAARIRMTITFDGAYGFLKPTWSACLGSDGAVHGACLVGQGSVWDEGLDCPFVLDLFVHPDHRLRGLGRALLCRAAANAEAEGAKFIGLRVGPNTSPAAKHLYRCLGFTEPSRRPQ